jgi:hypothetical protein
LPLNRIGWFETGGYEKFEVLGIGFWAMISLTRKTQ